MAPKLNQRCVSPVRAFGEAFIEAGWKPVVDGSIAEHRSRGKTPWNMERNAAHEGFCTNEMRLQKDVVAESGILDRQCW
jgi:hypothetical protein